MGRKFVFIFPSEADGGALILQRISYVQEKGHCHEDTRAHLEKYLDRFCYLPSRSRLRLDHSHLALSYFTTFAWNIYGWVKSFRSALPVKAPHKTYKFVEICTVEKEPYVLILFFFKQNQLFNFIFFSFSDLGCTCVRHLLQKWHLATLVTFMEVDGHLKITSISDFYSFTRSLRK